MASPDGVAGSLDVRDAVALLIGGHVVDRGKVKEMVDACGCELVLGRIVDAESRGPELADHGLDARPRLRTPGLDSRGQPLDRDLAHEYEDVAVALEQALDEVPADEAGGTRDEVARTRRRVLIRSPAAAPVSVV